MLPTTDEKRPTQLADSTGQKVVCHVPNRENRVESTGRNRADPAQENLPASRSHPQIDEINADCERDINVVCVPKYSGEEAEVNLADREKDKNRADQEAESDLSPMGGPRLGLKMRNGEVFLKARQRLAQWAGAGVSLGAETGSTSPDVASGAGVPAFISAR